MKKEGRRSLESKSPESESRMKDEEGKMEEDGQTESGVLSLA